MTTIARIAEKWTVTIEEQKDPESFLKWALKEPHNVSGHLVRSWYALKAIADLFEPGDIKSVMEYFGGMGAHALMVEELFSPTTHHVLDFSEEAVTHLKRTVPQLDIFQGDAYLRSSFRKVDLVVFDCGDLTVWKTRELEHPRIALDRIFDVGRPKAIMITDIAAPYLHLQIPRYESLLGEGTCRNYPDYIAAFARYLKELYGYTLLKAYVHRWSTVMALIPVELSGGIKGEVVTETPSSPIGLELL